MIELQHVSKRYDHGDVPVEALRDISLTISPGEFVSIMGPSGSGKSTLLNLLSALDRPTSGSIILDGRPIATLSDDQVTLFRRNRIGLIFQFFNLLPTLTAMENVLLPVLMGRAASRDDRARARALLEHVGLGHRLDHKPGQLSGGEMQRVAIARAFVTAPPIILADEPTGNLDSTSGREVLQLLRRQASEHGATVVMVTHDEQAARVGTRLLVIRDGAIQRDERLPRPAHDSAEAAPADSPQPREAAVLAASGVS
ncbi:MAG: ABC transporter ATP-binding protein [Deltaproteobacteria bacterium]|nr:ABC transporter ATP-binding protein [Deltaproteobacteria bacterium]